MIKLYKTYNTEAIKDILYDETIYKYVEWSLGDTLREDYEPDFSHSLFLLIQDHYKSIGYVELEIHTPEIYEIHLAVKPSHRGKRFTEIGNLIVDYLKIKTACKYLIAYIPDTHKHVNLLAKKFDFEEVSSMTVTSTSIETTNLTLFVKEIK